MTTGIARADIAKGSIVTCQGKNVYRLPHPRHGVVGIAIRDIAQGEKVTIDEPNCAIITKGTASSERVYLDSDYGVPLYLSDSIDCTY